MRDFKVLQVIRFSFIFILAAQSVAQGEESVGSSKLTDRNKKNFFNALHVVGTKREDKNTWPIIESAFKSDEVRLRLVGIRLLAGRAKGIPKSRSKIIPFLAKVAMEDKDSVVRGRAMSMIARYTKMDIVIEALTKMLTDEYEFNRQYVLKTIVGKKVKKAIPALKKTVAQEKNKKLKKKMAEAITLLEKGKHIEKDDAELDELLKQLENTDPQKRHMAIAQLQVYELEDSERVIKALINVYKKEDVKGNKIEILAALTLIGEDNDDVISLIKEEANSKDKDIRDIAKAMLECKLRQ